MKKEGGRMLIIAIVLTFFVWRKGWKWKSLLPMVIIYSFTVLLGFILGMNGIQDEQLFTMIGFLVDLSVIIALVVMLFVKPSVNQQHTSQPAVE